MRIMYTSVLPHLGTDFVSLGVRTYAPVHSKAVIAAKLRVLGKAALATY
jgi:hypothetical protein